MGQARLSSETLGKVTSESILAIPEVKPAKPVRGSMLLAKGKSESHSSGSQKQHHQHSSETPQVHIRAPQRRAGLLGPQHPAASLPQPHSPGTIPEKEVDPAGVRSASALTL